MIDTAAFIQKTLREAVEAVTKNDFSLMYKKLEQVFDKDLSELIWLFEDEGKNLSHFLRILPIINGYDQGESFIVWFEKKRNSGNYSDKLSSLYHAINFYFNDDDLEIFDRVNPEIRFFAELINEMIPRHIN